jgi:hypothetical protein
MYSYSVATPTGEGFFAQEIPNESEPIDKIMLPEGSGMMVGGYRAVSAQSARSPIDIAWQISYFIR